MGVDRSTGRRVGGGAASDGGDSRRAVVPERPVFLAKMDSRLRGSDTGLGSGHGAQFVPPPPSSPSLTRGSSRSRRLRTRSGGMDGRVKPGHDEAGVWTPDLAVRQAQGEVLRGIRPDLALRRAQGEVRLGGEALSPVTIARCGEARTAEQNTLLMVRCERSEPRTIRAKNPSTGLLPPPRSGSRFSWPRWIRACAGMTPGCGPWV